MLPIFEYTLTDEVEGLQAIALVDEPAIGIKYAAFNNMKFEVLDEDKRIVVGAAMIPDLPIYRRDEERGEYYAIFSKKTIEGLVQKFFKESKTAKFNEMHDPMKFYDGVYLYQSFITDKKLGITAPKGLENVADGTWFIAAKVDNNEAWDKVKKEGLLKGFSVEGIFDIIPYKHKFNNMNKLSLESVINTLKGAFSTEEVVEETMGTDTLVDGTEVKWEGELEVGTAITVVTPEGEVQAPDGQHELQSGTVIETVGGLVSNIVGVEDEMEFTLDQLDEMLGKALGLWYKDLKLEEKFEKVSILSDSVESFENKIKDVENKLVAKFNEVLSEVAEGLEDLRRNEYSTTNKPTEFKQESRAERAARLASFIKSQKSN